MNNLPSSSQPRYQKIKTLGSNPTGSRTTYLVTDNTTNNLVVIKQFSFAKSTSSWSSFKTYEREIQVLSFLQHPGIPRYLNSFETTNGFCIVQEYKNAQSLAVNRNFNLEQIKKIAINCLEILIYLQNRIPPVIHRDIKPENILVDDELNVYLVDFGFARIGSGEGAMSSVAAGTFGFMAPEQIYNQNLSKATDLYGLGITLVCLLTGTKSSSINTLVNESGKINVKPILSKLHPHLIEWLEKMAQPNQKERYSSAEEALTALKPVNFTLVPEVHFNQNFLVFKCNQIGEKITQTITITNPAFNTLLEGIWKVEPHPNDPPHKLSSHSWISFTPAKFKSNHIDCLISVDTSKLLADEVYNRQLLLETNSEPIKHNLNLRVHTVKIVDSIFYYPALLFLYFLITMPFCYFMFSLIFSILMMLDSNKIFQEIIAFIIPYLYSLIGIFPILLAIDSFLIKEYTKIGFNYKFILLIKITSWVFSGILGIELLMSNSFFKSLIMTFSLMGTLFIIRLIYQKSHEQINKYHKSIQSRIKA